ncbi:hypothetical protein E3C22_12850 [Jiella endophytica]|uniref:Uncharacterized protein n=1 Tax=Jiella endophytica TaxID=2558362 RepID=A0A4Y8RKP0_9HYPH|nr:hypothetical protein [Jiella endophytica]TFF23307.1 hypothetical protein E3C22_12850 [Jiella endophytica]
MNGDFPDGSLLREVEPPRSPEGSEGSEDRRVGGWVQIGDVGAAAGSLGSMPSFALDNVQMAARGARGFVVGGLRHVQDHDIFLLNHRPTVYVMTNQVDMAHLTMHLYQGRLQLTPFDRLVAANGDEDVFTFARPWAARYFCSAGEAQEFIAADGMNGPLPAGFAGLPKSVYLKLAEAMHPLQLTPYSPVVAATPACTHLVGSLIEPTKTLCAAAEKLPVDIHCIDAGSIDLVTDLDPLPRFIIVPTVTRAEETVESISVRLRARCPKPVTLAKAMACHAVPAGRVGALVFEIG